jgi:hypothetical protein
MAAQIAITGADANDVLTISAGKRQRYIAVNDLTGTGVKRLAIDLGVNGSKDGAVGHRDRQTPRRQ